MNKLLVGVLSLTFISACSAPAVKDTLLIQQSAQEQAKELGLSPQEVLDETRDLQILAQREDLYFYSPTYIAQAEEEIRKAESAFEDKLPAQQIVTHALTGQQLLKRGLENKKTVLTQLKLALDGLALLEKLNAPTLFEGDYADVQDDTKDLIILIEQGNTTQALNDQNSVLTEIADIEIKVLKKTYLGQAEVALEKAVDADAEDFAPESIDKAELGVEKLALFIEKNRKQLQAIADETQKAVHLAQHAEHVSIAVEPLLKLKITEAEQHVLFIEKLIARIGQALNQKDVTYLPLDNQSIALAQAAETISKQAMAIKQQGQWQAEKAELEAKLAKLQAKLEDALKQPEKAAPAAGDSTQINPAQDTSTVSVDDTAVIPAANEKDIVETTGTAQDKENAAHKELAKEAKQTPTEVIQEATAAIVEATPEAPIEEAAAEVTQQASEPASSATESQVAKAPAAETEAEPQVITNEQAENKTP